jgi:hypothetical protein
MREIFVIARGRRKPQRRYDACQKACGRREKRGRGRGQISNLQSWVLCFKDRAESDYQTEKTNSEESQLEMLHKLELSYSDFRELKRTCDTLGTCFFLRHSIARA